MIDMPMLAFAMCGSFCTFEKALAQLALLRKDWDMLPVMSETAYTTDTRFGTAESFHERIENIGPMGSASAMVWIIFRPQIFSMRS